MFKLLQDNKENKDNSFKNLALIPGLNIDSTSNENIKLFRNVEKNRELIDEKIFLKFYHLIDTKNDKKKKTRRLKLISNSNAQTKKQKKQKKRN
jgi:hypothetical protein